MALVSLRKASSSWFFKGLLIVLAFTFAAFFGVTGNPFQRVTALIEVGDEAIDAQTLLREFDRSRNEMSRLFGQVLTPEEARNLGLLDQTIQQIATRTLFDVAARDLGVVVTDLQVAETIRGNPQFQAVAGRFDRLTFDSYLTSFGYSEGYYTELLRQDLIREQFLDSLLLGAAAPDILIDTLHRYRAERRIAEIVDVSADTIGSVGFPDETAIQSYYDGHSAIFTAPEYRSLVVAYLTPTLLAAEMSTSEADIQQEYDLLRSLYETPERRTVEQVVFTADRRDDAQALVDAVRGGQEFATAVAAVEGVFADELGTIGRDDLLVPALADAVFAASEGAVTDLVETPFGWHVALVTAITRAETSTIDDVRETLAEDLALRRANDTIFEVMEALDDALAGGATIEEAANLNGAVVATIPAIARTGAAPDGGVVQDLPALAEVVATAFRTQEGRESQVIESGGGGFFVLRVTGAIEPALRRLEDVRDEVVAGWQADERSRLAEDQAEAVAARITAGEAPSTVADKYGLSMVTTEPFTRTSEGAEGAVSGATAAALFDESVGGVVVQPTADGFQVAKLLAVRAPTSEQRGARTSLGVSLAGAMGGDLQAQLAEVLLLDYGMSVDRAAINNLFNAP